MVLFDALFKLYQWGAVPVLFTALVAVLPAYVLNQRRPGQFVDAWLLIWATQLFIATLALQIAADDLLLLESRVPPGSSSEALGPESGFYYGAVKGTSLFAALAVIAFLIRGLSAKPLHQDFR